MSGAVSLRIQQLDVACETKTKDNVFVNVVVSVQYQVWFEMTDIHLEYSLYLKRLPDPTDCVGDSHDVSRSLEGRLMLEFFACPPSGYRFWRLDLIHTSFIV